MYPIVATCCMDNPSIYSSYWFSHCSRSNESISHCCQIVSNCLGQMGSLFLHYLNDNDHGDSISGKYHENSSLGKYHKNSISGKYLYYYCHREMISLSKYISIQNVWSIMHLCKDMYICISSKKPIRNEWETSRINWWSVSFSIGAPAGLHGSHDILIQGCQRLQPLDHLGLAQCPHTAWDIPHLEH